MAELSNEMYEQLRQILEKQNGLTYTLEETKEIGDGLLDFYHILLESDIENEKEGAAKD